MPGSVLIVNDDENVSTLVVDILTEAGFTVSELTNPSPTAIHTEVARTEPDVILLDGADKMEYGQSWADAAWLHEREPPIACIMFTCHRTDIVEGKLAHSERSRRAAFVGFLAKPFDIDALVDLVTRVARAPSAALGMPFAISAE